MAHTLSQAKRIEYGTGGLNETGLNETVQAASERLFIPSTNTTIPQAKTTVGTMKGELMSHATVILLGLATLAFVVTFLVAVYILRRKF